MVSQSTIIAGFLMLAFLVFITAKGQLPAYLYVLGVSAGTNNPLTNPNQGTAIQGINSGQLQSHALSFGP
jgi:hypothetical protein